MVSWKQYVWNFLYLCVKSIALNKGPNNICANASLRKHYTEVIQSEGSRRTDAGSEKGVAA